MNLIIKKILNKNCCPVEKITKILSDQWTILIIRDLIKESRRFSELEKSLQGISTRTLTIKLNNLIDEEIVQKDNYNYSITTKGLKLKCLIDEMAKIGQKI